MVAQDAGCQDGGSVDGMLIELNVADACERRGERRLGEWDLRHSGQAVGIDAEYRLGDRQEVLNLEHVHQHTTMPRFTYRGLTGMPIYAKLALLHPTHRATEPNERNHDGHHEPPPG
jgi:hypothetical protein